MRDRIRNILREVAGKTIDEEYIKSLQDKDMKRARKIILDVAQQNGYTILAYHGTNEKFHSFSKEKLGSKNWLAESAREGFFFAKSKETAKAYIGFSGADTLGTFGLGGWENPKSEEVRRAKMMYGKKLELSIKRYEDKKQEVYDRIGKQWEEDHQDQIDKLADVFREIKDKQKARDVLLLWRSSDPKWKEAISQADMDIEDSPEAKENRALNQKIFKYVERKSFERKGLAKRVLNVILKIQNPYVFDYKNVYDDGGLTMHIHEAKKQGKDGVIFKNLSDGADVDDIYVIFDANQVKYIDTITRDDEENIIPPSKRFDGSIDDMRY